MSAEAPQDDLLATTRRPELRSRGDDVELLVGSLLELVQCLSDGQRRQVESLGALADAIHRLTVAQIALQDELARLRAEVGSRDGAASDAR